MIRRAFGNAFSDYEVEDLYSAAWLGTIRALENRHEELSDEEMRRYVLAAVANQAARELRRRGRRPTAPLEAAIAVADTAELPDQVAARAEDSQLARDVLASLPPRRRAVLLFRYGWELAPQEICALVEGLSHRAYRKEITKGVDELARKLSLVEAGEWCDSRAPLLNSVAAGTADDDETLQVKQHLAHCRPCAEYFGRLGASLHDVGGALALLGVLDVISSGPVGFAERVGELAERGKDVVPNWLGRGSEVAEPITSTIAGSGAVRGGGAAGVGMIAKLGGIGFAGKTVAVCVGTGAAAATCVASGVVPGLGGAGRDDGDPPARERQVDEAPRDEPEADTPPPAGDIAPTVVEAAPTPTAPPSASADEGLDSTGADGPPAGDHGDEPHPGPEPAGEPAPEAAEFEPIGEPAPAPSPAPVTPPASSGSASPGGAGSSSAGGGSASGGSGDFGP